MSDYAIVVEHLVKTFRTPLALKKVRAVRDISFRVKRGEIFGFLGPNGAGKTTTIKVLTSLIRPTKGRVEVLGGRPGDLKVARRMGFLPETPNFYDYLTGEEFLDIIARFYELDYKTRKKRVAELLDLVGLGYAAKRKLRKYSKGMLQRIGIAQALIGDPELVILDEPLSGLDPIGRRQVRDIIADLKTRGKTVFFSSHILSDIEMICDEVAILNKGKVVTAGALDELLSGGHVMAEIVAEGSIHSKELPDFLKEVDQGPGFIKVNCDFKLVNEALRYLMDQGLRIKNVTEARISLEDLLMKHAFEEEE